MELEDPGSSPGLSPMKSDYLNYVRLKDIRSYLDGGSIEIILTDCYDRQNHFFVIDHRIRIGTGKIYAGGINTFDQPGARLATEYEIEAIKSAINVVSVTCKEALDDIEKIEK